MDVSDAIRTRRTVKAFAPEPLTRDQLNDLLDLARWAPNHNLTAPWRLRVVGPQALERLMEVAASQAAAAAPAGADAGKVGAIAAAKLNRAPTLVVVSAKRHADPIQHEEDLHSTACAAYAVLLGAHERGLAAYWRTPSVLRTDDGLTAVGVGADEQFVALLYLGHPAGAAPATSQRPPLDDVVIYLD